MTLAGATASATSNPASTGAIIDLPERSTLEGALDGTAPALRWGADGHRMAAHVAVRALPDDPADPIAVAFTADRLADGAAMLRDLWWSAWVESEMVAVR